MRTSLLRVITFVGVGLFVSLSEAPAAPAIGSSIKQAEPKDAKFSHGLELKARKYDEPNFGAQTTKYGVECYLDPNSGLCVYISQTGSIAVVPGVPAAGKEPKNATFSHGLVLKARKADEANFGENTKRYGVECYKDENNGNTIYITEAGNIAACKGVSLAPKQPVDAAFSHGIVVKARKHDEADFKDAKSWGIECYEDKNNKVCLYVTESGSIAITTTGGSVAGQKPIAAKFNHGLVLKARKHDQADFKEARPFGVEAYNDDNSKNGVQITETGNITASEKLFDVIMPGNKPKDAKFSHGLVLKVRKAGEANFGPTTKKVGIECYEDQNTPGNMAYVTDGGSISVMKK